MRARVCVCVCVFFVFVQLQLLVFEVFVWTFSTGNSVAVRISCARLMQCTGSAPVQVLPCRSQVLERLQAIFEAFGAVVPGVTNRLVLPLDGFDRGSSAI